jgi:phosphoribosylanthranilate isomerase
MLVKICGLTRLEDAEVAVALGAGALGFVFWPKSPRYVDPERARAIVAALPPFVTTVGVFVDQAPRLVNGIAARVGLGAVQLHGDEPIAVLDHIDRPVVKAFAMRASTHAADADIWPPRVRLLIDVHDAAQRGGTGRTVDWQGAAAIASRRPVLLAGGLKPGNVAEAIRVVRPFGIDVSSGVESAPGLKDHARMRALFEAVAECAGPEGSGPRTQGGSLGPTEGVQT